MKKRHAEIVGAGFAGLTAACALAQRGWSVRVHERADRLRTAGAGIYIYENGLRVLEAVGAYEAAVKGAPLAHTREVRDGRDRLISVHRWVGSRVFSIVRQNVINALAAVAATRRRRDCDQLRGNRRNSRWRTDAGEWPKRQSRPDRWRRWQQFATAQLARPSVQAKISRRWLHASAD